MPHFRRHSVTIATALLTIVRLCLCLRSDMSRFGKVVKLAAFKPFSSAADALEQINAVSEAQMTDALKVGCLLAL